MDFLLRLEGEGSYRRGHIFGEGLSSVGHHMYSTGLGVNLSQREFIRSAYYLFTSFDRLRCNHP
jgi:hypothetical protein